MNSMRYWAVFASCLSALYAALIVVFKSLTYEITFTKDSIKSEMSNLLRHSSRPFILLVTWLQIYNLPQHVSYRSQAILSVEIVVIIISILSIINSYKTYIAGKHYGKLPDIKGKVYIITGSNTGIGYEVAKELAKRGAKIVLACRSVDKAQTAVESIIKAVSSGDLNAAELRFRIIFIELNLASFKSVEQFVVEFMRTGWKLDVLINNAGVMLPSCVMTEDDLETTMQSNHTSVHKLTKLLLASVPSISRVIFTSSSLHKSHSSSSPSSPYNMWTAYAHSKYCSLRAAKQLSTSTSTSTLCQILSLHPGVVMSNISNNMPNWLRAMEMLSMPLMMAFRKSTNQGAWTTLYAACSDDVKGMSGVYLANCQVASTLPELYDNLNDDDDVK